ncbi:MAG: LapA family protein [Pseudomonadales bacterium]
MGFIKKALFLFIALVAFLVALLAAADNSAEVALRFLEYETPVWPISWWMISAFVVGVVFGNLLNVVSNTRLRMEARRERKTAEGRTQELDQAKAQTKEQPVSPVPAEIK